MLPPLFFGSRPRRPLLRTSTRAAAAQRQLARARLLVEADHEAERDQVLAGLVVIGDVEILVVEPQQQIDVVLVEPRDRQRVQKSAAAGDVVSFIRERTADLAEDVEAGLEDREHWHHADVKAVKVSAARFLRRVAEAPVLELDSAVPVKTRKGPRIPSEIAAAPGRLVGVPDTRSAVDRRPERLFHLLFDDHRRGRRLFGYHLFVDHWACVRNSRRRERAGHNKARSRRHHPETRNPFHRVPPSLPWYALRTFYWHARRTLSLVRAAYPRLVCTASLPSLRAAYLVLFCAVRRRARNFKRSPQASQSRCARPLRAS